MNRSELVRLLAFALVVGAVVACDDDPPTAQPLNAPTNLTATEVSPTSIRLNWTAAAGATGYLVQRAPGASGGTFAQVGGGLVTGTTFTDNIPSPGTFRYRVASVRGSDTSAFTAVQTATTTETFTASLTGDAERPTPRQTPAEGEAEVTFRNDTIRWTVTTTNITNVTAAHIHHGVVDSAGGIILSFVPSTGCGGGACNAGFSGFVTRAGFQPQGGVGFDSLLVLIRAGRTYVNVHTSDGVPPNDTGPGDFPGGEIRGQLASAAALLLLRRRRRSVTGATT
jgi:hypothetical protein